MANVYVELQIQSLLLSTADLFERNGNAPMSEGLKEAAKRWSELSPALKDEIRSILLKFIVITQPHMSQDLYVGDDAE